MTPSDHQLRSDQWLANALPGYCRRWRERLDVWPPVDAVVVRQLEEYHKLLGEILVKLKGASHSS